MQQIYSDLNAGDIWHFFGTSRSAFICVSIGSCEAKFIPIKLAFKDKARHAEAEDAIGCAIFDLTAINITTM